MKFLLTVSSNFIVTEKIEKYQKLGFEFHEEKAVNGAFIKVHKKVYIKIETLEDLIKFKNEYGKIIIKSHWNRFEGKEDGDEIEIYNDLRENKNVT